MVNGKLTNNPADVAEALNYYFADSVVKITQCFSPQYTEVCPVNTVEQALTLSLKCQKNNSLKPSRAKDIFSMDVVMLKELSESLVNPITDIINLSVSQGMFHAWKSSVIVPIFKRGDPHSASNYRPISILPIVSKVAEKLMAAQITNYLNNSSFALHPMQFGFRANFSTEMANCYFTEKVKSLLDKGRVVGVVFLDLRRAFDTVNHRILMFKLLGFNFSLDTIRWIESYLAGHPQYVSIQNYKSAPISISTGVPQGSILGPLLFMLYVNGLPSICPNTNIQMYADDTVIYIHRSSISQVASEPTESLVHVTAWLEQCCLQLNISKTVCMFFTKTNSSSVVPDVFVSGERLQVVSEYKYLCVLIYSRLSFKA
uniref:Reverse transcriptase domain-containing protein n=1 Tax=Cyprinus carpio TaxID=7962 RepID=A0A8C2IBW3_CYPCA